MRLFLFSLFLISCSQINSIDEYKEKYFYRTYLADDDYESITKFLQGKILECYKQSGNKESDFLEKTTFDLNKKRKIGFITHQVQSKLLTSTLHFYIEVKALTIKTSQVFFYAKDSLFSPIGKLPQKIELWLQGEPDSCR